MPRSMKSRGQFFSRSEKSPRNLFHDREIWNSDKVEEKSEFCLLNLPFKDFLFYSFTYFSKHLAEAKNKRKINK